jgi:hypothetical protein
MQYVFLAIPLLVAGWYLLSLALAWGEKDHVKNDMIPGSIPTSWKSAFLDEKSAEAANLGLEPCGEYQTAPHASIVKGYTRLYLTPARTAFVALTSARMGGLEIKKTVIRSRLSDQQAIETNDCASTADPTGGIKVLSLWQAELAEVLATHEARLQMAATAVAPVSPADVFSQYEQIDVDRGQRMVDQKLAAWTDPSRSTFRRTLKGALATMRANKRQTAALLEREKQRIAREKKQAG